MIKKLNALIDFILKKLKLIKYREQIIYIGVGGMTTVVDWLIFWVFEKFIPPVAGEFINKISPNIIAYAVAWFGAVIFAYVCSKLFVFERDDEATSFEKEGIVSQFIKFFLSRFGTLVLSIVGDFVLCSETVGIELNAYLVKAIISVAVIIINYITSKFLVFNKTKKEEK